MQKVNMYDQEMPQSHNAEQTMAHRILIITCHQKVIKVEQPALSSWFENDFLLNEMIIML